MVKMIDESAVRATLNVMLCQEEAGYTVEDDFLTRQVEEMLLLQQLPPLAGEDLQLEGVDQQQLEGDDQQQRGPLNAASSTAQNDEEVNQNHVPVDGECRYKISTWCYQVADYAKFGSRESVEVAMNYLDRYLTTDAGREALQDREQYQRAAMTALYLAVKVHEPEAMAPKFVTKLSRGTFTPEEVVAMEARMLCALEWKLNPPTSMSFARQLLDLVLLSNVLGDNSLRNTVHEITRCQAELAVNEYALCGAKSSTIALGAILNALESVVNDGNGGNGGGAASPAVCGGISPSALDYVERILVEAVAGFDAEAALLDEVWAVQDVLYRTVVRDPSSSVTFDRCRHHSSSSSLSSGHSSTAGGRKHGGVKRSTSFHESPRSVSTSPIPQPSPSLAR